MTRQPPPAAAANPNKGTVILAMDTIKRLIQALDRLQQRHAWLAVPVAVWKKFGDDQAGNLAALIAYSALVAIFPLLLLLVTVLDIVLKNNQELQEKVVNAALERYPVIGPALEGQIGHLSQAGIALAVAVIGIFIGSLGVANSVQNALNSVWEIPFDRRPGFPWSWLRSGALIVVVGTGFIATTFLSGLAADAVHFLSGEGQKVLTYAVSLVLNFGVLWLASRLGTASEITWRQLWLGAAISSIIWTYSSTSAPTSCPVRSPMPRRYTARSPSCSG